MLIDKEYILAGLFALITIVLFSFVIYAPSDELRTERARPIYAKDDVRYRYQQDELKHPKKKKKAVEDSFVTDGSSSSSSNDDSAEDDSPAEEPSVSDHEPQEEPEIE
jgi:hypothetical protein